jgi:hypothetical protein
MYQFSKDHIAADWQWCKRAHADAKQMWDLQGGFAPESVRPFYDRLADLAMTFESVHGLEFNPNAPITEKEAA